ncbi:MAG: citrate lyase holo-[acyl-carrier protein] synthase [Peptococcaceae bacterium]|nr:citrate lyase holo-[acyl-carrier protein] synthase [Peptococcaceae bacterium]
MENNLFEQILRGREQRAERQRQLIETYQKPLVSLTLNIPGPDKISSPLDKVHSVGVEILEKELKNHNYAVVWKEQSVNPAGHQAFLVVDADPRQLKELTVNIEEQQPLGRIFDYDVFDCGAKQVNRELLGLRGRTCLLCGEKTDICRRSKKHTLDELMNCINQIIKQSEVL